MAGQRFKSRAGLVRGVIGLMLLVLVLALIAPVLAQRGRGRRRGGFPNAGVAGANAGGQTNAGGGRRGRRNRGGNGGFTGGVPRLPGRFTPVPKVEGGGPVGPTIAAPSTFRVLLPQDGATVRGVVDVQVPAANMPAGSYVSFAVNELNGFKYATIRTPSAGVFDWKWDTRELAPGTDTQLYRDGNYTLYAFAHDPTGREMDNGQAQITLTVKNSLTVPGPVRLSYRMPLGDEHIYQSDYSLSVHQATPTANVPKITGMARWAVTVDDYDRADEVAAVSALFTDVSAEDQLVMNNGRLVPGTWNATFFQDLFSQHSGSFELTTDGQRLTPLGRPGPYDYARVGLAANTYIPLPDQPVTVNSSWRGPLTIWTIGNHNHRTRIGSSVNTLVGFEWLDNIKTAKIKTDYSVSLPPPGQASPVAAGAQLGNMASSFGGAAAQTPVLATGQLTAERITWFDYENGRVLRAVDTRQITNLPSLFVEEGGAAASGGGGYPGAGGGGYPGVGGGAATTPAADLSWLPGFGFSSAAAQQAAVSGAAGFGGGFSGGGYPGMAGGYPGLGGGGYPGFGGGYPGVAGGGFPGGVAGTEGDLGGKPAAFGGGYPGMGGGGYPGFGGGGYPGMGGGYPGMGGGYPGMGGGYPGMGGGYPGVGGGYPGMGGGVGSPFGAVPTAPTPAAGGTFQVAGPPKFDEIIDTHLLTGQQASGTES